MTKEREEQIRSEVENIRLGLKFEEKSKDELQLMLVDLLDEIDYLRKN